MNKKLITLAIATAFAAPVAMADSGNVKISGEINMSFDSSKGAVGGTGQTDNQTFSNISSNASNVSFSGDEDLGNGMKAIWQVQTYTTLGGNGNSDTASTASDAFGNGNSFLGLNGGFGTVRLGKFDTVFKTVGRKVDLFTNSVGDARNLTASGVVAGTSNLWDLRVTNAIDYVTPALNGFQGVVAYATNIGSNGTVTTTTSANTTPATSVISVGGTYENGPVFVGLAYERHNTANSDQAAATAAAGRFVTAPTAWRLSGGYNFGDLKIVGMYQNTKDNNGTEGVATNATGTNGATTSDDDRNVWGLGAAYKMGSNTLKAQYYRAGDFGNISETGANLIAVGVDHAMSKRTTAYVAYARTANDSRSVNGASANLAAFSATAGGHGDNAGTIAGQSPNSISVGMIHKF